MNILFIADPMATFKTYKDTTYAMMREMAVRGWRLSHTLSSGLAVKNGVVTAQAAAFEFIGAKDDYDKQWFKEGESVQEVYPSWGRCYLGTCCGNSSWF